MLASARALVTDYTVPGSLPCSIASKNLPWEDLLGKGNTRNHRARKALFKNSERTNQIEGIAITHDKYILIIISTSGGKVRSFIISMF